MWRASCFTPRGEDHEYVCICGLASQERGILASLTKALIRHDQWKRPKWSEESVVLSADRFPHQTPLKARAS
jgi:hypothetical protein